MHLKLLEKKVIQKTAETTWDLILNETTNKITKVSQPLHKIIQRRLQRKQKILNLIQKHQ